MTSVSCDIAVNKPLTKKEDYVRRFLFPRIQVEYILLLYAFYAWWVKMEAAQRLLPVRTSHTLGS